MEALHGKAVCADDGGGGEEKIINVSTCKQMVAMDNGK